MNADDRFNPMDYQQAWSWPRLMSPFSSWVPHIPFAMSLVEMCRPDRIVELGTLHGDSYCAFCQAVDQLKLPTRCTPVDTWEGDQHAGKYGPEVLNGLREHHDPLYGKFSTLLQSTFDNALAQVPDGSVDILHIDGFHSYDAVKHDYENWKPKLSDRGVVLFHDSQVRDPGFGVWTLWEEISPQYPSFEMHHAFGLAILAVGANAPEPLLRFLRQANADPAGMRLYYKLLGDCLDNARIAITMMGNVQRMQQMLDQRKKMINEPITSGDPNNAYLSPLPYMERMMLDVQNVTVAELRHRGFDVQSAPAPARVRRNS